MYTAGMEIETDKAEEIILVIIKQKRPVITGLFCFS